MFDGLDGHYVIYEREEDFGSHPTDACSHIESYETLGDGIEDGGCRYRRVEGLKMGKEGKEKETGSKLFYPG